MIRWVPETAPGCLHRPVPCRNYGYDPLKLGKDEASLARFREAEIIHGRWAMLGTAGCLVPELLGMGDMFSAPEWVSPSRPAHQVTYLSRFLFVVPG